MVQDRIEIKRALISVNDTSGLADLMKKLQSGKRDIEVIATSETANEIRRLGYSAITVAEYTGSTESPDLRALDPTILGGLLLDPAIPEHDAYMQQQNTRPIDLVVADLPPFQNEGDAEKSAKNIDVGGPTMVRAAGKGFKRVATIVNWKDLELLQESGNGIGTDLEMRATLMQHAFAHTCKYEGEIDDFFSNRESTETEPHRVEIKRALISVYDKSGLADLMKRLQPDKRGIELISSGGTAKEIAKMGYQVIDVSTYTGHPESPGGLVKTLLRKIHDGLLPHPGQDAPPIDLFVGNLYPFQTAVVKSPGDYEKIKENIDIGGPTMVRSAARGFTRVAVIVNWSDLDLLGEWETKEPGNVIGTTAQGRFMLMKHAFEHTRNYEGAIADFWTKQDPKKIAEFYLKGEKK